MQRALAYSVRMRLYCFLTTCTIEPQGAHNDSPCQQAPFKRGVKTTGLGQPKERRSLQELLKVGVFISAGRDRYAFVHQSCMQLMLLCSSCSG